MKYVEVCKRPGTRVVLVNSFLDSKAIKFLQDKGMYKEFCLYKQDHIGVRPTYLTDFELNNYNCEYDKFNIDNDEYITIHYKNRHVTEIYKLLSPVYNDDTFHWSENKKYKTLESTVCIGAFEYNCIFNKNGESTIDVRYTKCDNRHRNKVTISTIDNIYDANNEVFMAAINQWRNNMVDEGI